MARKQLLLVGAGRWGKVFLRNLHQHSRAVVAGIVTSQPREAIPFLENGTELFTEFSASLRSPWDGVILVTPPEVHDTQLEICLEKGHPVLVEKPLSLNSASAKKLAALALTTKTPVLVDHTMLFHPGFEWLKDFFSKPGAPSITHISSEGCNTGPYRSSYSPLWDYGAHDLSMLLSLLAEDPNRVEAQAEEISQKDNGWAGTYLAKLDFPSGVSSTFRVSNLSSSKIRNISVETTSEKYTLEDFPKPRLYRANLKGGVTTEIPLPQITPIEKLLDVFCDGLEGQFDPRWGISLGERVVRVLEACEHALK